MKKFMNTMAVAALTTLSTCAVAVAQPACFTPDTINAINEEQGYIHVFDGMAVEGDGSIVHTVTFANPISGEWVQLLSPDLECYYVLTTGFGAEFTYSPDL